MLMLSEVTRVFIGLALTFGPLMGLLVLLNHRDRREHVLRDVVLDVVPLHKLRGLIAIQVHCPLLSPRCVVTIDMLSCSRAQIWEIFAQLAQSLPSHVRLIVSGSMDRQFTSTFTLETTSRNPLYCPRQASAVTG